MSHWPFKWIEGMAYRVRTDGTQTLLTVGCMSAVLKQSGWCTGGFVHTRWNNTCHACNPPPHPPLSSLSPLNHPAITFITLSDYHFFSPLCAPLRAVVVLETIYRNRLTFPPPVEPHLIFQQTRHRCCVCVCVKQT